MVNWRLKSTAARTPIRLLVAALFLGVCLGQTPEPSRHWALIIGISNYTNAEPLLYASSDARALAEFLKSPRGGSFPADHVITLLESDASRYQLLVEMEALQNSIEPGDTVYVFLAGHGYVTNRGIGYFIPSDGDLRVPAATSVPFSHLKELVELGLAQAGQRVLITDMCNAGRIGPQQSELSKKIQNVINEDLLKLGGPQDGNFLNLLASQPTEASWERDDLKAGVFTHTLLEALNGKAAESQNKIVMAQEVVDYVEGEVPKYTANQQHPVSNRNFDQQLPLSFLDLPGPSLQIDDHTHLVILNPRNDLRRVEWVDGITQARAVHTLAADEGKLEIGSLQPGEMELLFFDSEDRPHPVKVSLQSGRNELDLAAQGLGSLRPLAPIRVASLSGVFRLLLSQLPSTPLPATPALTNATLLMRVDSDTEIYLDDSLLVRGRQDNELVQLQGLSPGDHRLYLVASPEQEHRFRVDLFSGQQYFDWRTGILEAVSSPQTAPDLLPIPPGLAQNLVPSYRSFNRALWEGNLITPGGDSAWDYYQRMTATLHVDQDARMRNRLTVAMGNRAQRTILKYLEGGDVRWGADVFREGAELVRRAQQLFRPLPVLQSQEHFFVGRAEIEEGNFVAAEQQLQTAISLDPGASHAYNALGLALWKQDRLEEAVVPLQQAITLSPEWTYPRNTLALIHLETRRYQESEAGFRTSIQIDPGDSTAYHGLAQLLMLQGRRLEAFELLNSAIRVNPGNAYAYHTLGLLLAELPSIARPGIVAYVDPGPAGSTLSAGSPIPETSNAEDAIRLAIRLEPAESAFRISLAELFRRTGRRAEADTVFDTLLSQSPDKADLWQARAEFLERDDRTAEAGQAFQRSLALLPEDSRLRIRYGLFLMAKGDQKGARQEFEKAIQLNPKDAFAHHNLALILVRSQDRATAEAELKRAIEADAKYPAPYQLQGRLRMAEQRYGEALNSFQKARELSFDDYQRQELDELIEQARAEIVAGELAKAEKLISEKRLDTVWTGYAALAARAPEDRRLRQAILSFSDRYGDKADASLLPSSLALKSILSGNFWMGQSQAEKLWERGDRPAASLAFSEALDGLTLEREPGIFSTAFNLANEEFGIHVLVYRWALRNLEAGDYPAALQLMELSLQKKIFGIVPDYSPLTMDSLMVSEEIPQPLNFSDYEVALHPDPRAHEVMATVTALMENPSGAERYLSALTGLPSESQIRLKIARALIDRSRWEDSLQVLRPLQNHKEADQLRSEIRRRQRRN